MAPGLGPGRQFMVVLVNATLNAGLNATLSDPELGGYCRERGACTPSWWTAGARMPYIGPRPIEPEALDAMHSRCSA